MKMEREISKFSVEKYKWNKNMEMENVILRNRFFSAEAKTKTEERFLAEQTRKRKLCFRLMLNFCLYGGFVWSIYQTQYVTLSNQTV
jgi:hypothetical protein